MKNVLIGGIGNVLLSDDGVGPYLARSLFSRYDFAPGVEAADLGTPSLDLVDYLAGRDVVLLIDSVKMEEPPGTVKVYGRKDLLACRSALESGPHSPFIVESLYAAELLGVAPSHICLVGIAGANFAVGCGLSELVRKSIEPAIAAILTMLERIPVKFRRKGDCPANIWWETHCSSSHEHE